METKSNEQVLSDQDEKAPLTKPRRGRPSKKQTVEFDEDNKIEEANEDEINEELEPTQKVKKVRPPKTEKQMAAFKEKCVKGNKQKTLSNQKLLIESAKTILKKEISQKKNEVSDDSSESSESEEEPEIIHIKKSKKKAAKKKIVIVHSDSSDSEDDEDNLPTKQFGKSHRNKSTIKSKVNEKSYSHPVKSYDNGISRYFVN